MGAGVESSPQQRRLLFCLGAGLSANIARCARQGAIVEAVWRKPGGAAMKALTYILYLFSALLMLSAVLIFLPWSTLNSWMAWFAPVAYPDTPLVQYTVKVFFLIMFWIGVQLAVAVARRYPVMLSTLAGLFLSAAVLCLALGWIYDVPWFFYLDALSSAALGILVVVYRARATGN